jgi:phosphoenolpyruvate carboxykinase (ATP)
MNAPLTSAYQDPRALLAADGVVASGLVYRNLAVDALYQAATQRGQATVLANGALHHDTRPNTGRAAKSSFYVNDPAFRAAGRSLDELMNWGNPSAGQFDNLPTTPAVWAKLKARVVAHLGEAGDLYVHDGVSGRTDASRLFVRVVTPHAPAALFAQHIFLRPTADELAAFPAGGEDRWTILHAPAVEADEEDGTNGTTFIITNLGERTTIIGGTYYNGQIKKSIFAVQNFRLPLKGILTMHAGASEGSGGRSALHAGLSGTGKTTLSNTGFPVADDQIVLEIHGDPERVVSNMEGGQYAKTEKLRRDKEPEIWDAIRYGTVAENVWHDAAGHPDYDNLDWTANGRVGYPLEFVPSAKLSGCARAPKSITFLAADGFGVLPPVSRLSVDAARYHFAAGFTSRMPGTEKGVVEPKPVFSAFYGKPFMPLKPSWYMDLLAELIAVHGTQVWLVNTGWLGPNRPGRGRVDILVSKAIVNAVRDGGIDLSPDNFWFDPVFKLDVPRAVPGVDPELLDPRNFWADPAAYRASSNQLAEIFQDAVGRMPHMPADVLAAGPSPVN